MPPSGGLFPGFSAGASRRVPGGAFPAPPGTPAAQSVHPLRPDASVTHATASSAPFTATMGV